MSSTLFKIPEKVLVECFNEQHAAFTLAPLEPGYGHTIGNALRRTLISSLSGYAITRIKIDGVLHEFDTIQGVKEDVSNIILNLKKVRFKASLKQDKVVCRLELTNKTSFKAGEITPAAEHLEVLNSDFVICHMVPSVRLAIELTIERGRRYVSAESQIAEEQEELSEVGVLAIDAIFSPVCNVSYRVSNVLVRQKTDYEKLILEVETDGSISPEAALRSATRKLMQHFVLLGSQDLFEQDLEEDEEVTEEQMRMTKLLRTPLSKLELNPRAFNILDAKGVKCLGDILEFSKEDLTKFRNFGSKTAEKVEEMIESHGLSFGMDVSPFLKDK